ncbi:MAG: patatin-like phospholipase family protein [Bacteroidales bacterium]|nr:patatin-like phospholipase family protein [Bacteroidales bacterium]
MTYKRLKIKILTLLMLTATTANAVAQDTLTVVPDSIGAVPDSVVEHAPLKRPKIGLVLSGGGAKGLAHAGILNAIDSAGLQIDYITGTSMGAILAAMYAAGYNGHQIDSIARGMDWMQAMGSSASYSKMSIEQKDQYENYSVEFPVEGFHLRPTTGVLEPQEVMLKFCEVFYPVYKIKDFSKLNIPFKCIATDLSNGDAVVIDHGNLPYAVRSSMAIPGVFSATNYNNTKLVDGGIVRNFPVKDVREMGADFVIGVNLFSGLTHPKDMSSMIDVMLQVTNFRDANDLVNEKSVCDMVIEPNVSNYSSASFGSSQQILAIGDTVGKQFYPLFKQLADSLYNRYDVPYTSKYRIKPYNEKVRIDKFEFVGLQQTEERQIVHDLGLVPGSYYSPLEINEAFRNVYSSLAFSNLTYELIPTDDGDGVCLKCNVEELPLAAVKLGLAYNTFTGASLILGYTHKNLLGKRSITEAKLAISEAVSLRLSNLHYFGNRNRNLQYATYEFRHFYLPLYGEKSTKKEFIYSYFHNDFHIALGHLFGPRSDIQFKLGFELFNLRPDVVGDKGSINGRVHNFYLNIRKRYNSADRKYMPQRGALFEANLYWGIDPIYKMNGIDTTNINYSKYRDSKSFTCGNLYRFTAKGDFYQPIKERFTLMENFSLAAIYGTSTLTHQTYLGGVNEFLPSHFIFYGLNTAQKFEPTLASARLGLRYRLVAELYTSLHVNAACTFESLDKYIKDNAEFKIKEKIYGFGLTAAYNFSYLPFDLTLMYSPDYKFNVNVNVGINF